MNQKFQAIRGIAIIFVIMIHSLYSSQQNDVQSINIILRVILNCAVGIFIFLSGYFINVDKFKENKIEYYKKRVKRLYIPFLIFSIIYTIIEVILGKVDNLFEFVFQTLIGSSAAHLYYILVLIQLTFLTGHIVKVIEEKSKFRYIYLLVTPVAYIVYNIYNINTGNTIPFFGTIFINWLIYYYIGMYVNLNKEKVEKIVEKVKIKRFIVVYALILMALNIYGNYKYNNYLFWTTQLKVQNIIYVIGIIILILQSKKYAVYDNKILQRLGDNSFYIYFIHMILILMITKAIIILLPNCNFMLHTAILAVGTIISSYILHWISNKFLPQKLKKYLAI